MLLKSIDMDEDVDDFEIPLTFAALEGDLEETMFLLGQGADIEEVNEDGYTSLMIAAGEGHEELLIFLLSHGAEINTVTEETKETALTIACGNGSLELADFLIKAGADLELGECTALMRASQEGYLEIVRHLLTAGAKLTTTNSTGDSALTYACKKGHIEMVGFLLMLYEKLDKMSLVNIDFLLTLAVCGGHLDLVKMLLKRGANIETENVQGFTPLMEATRKDDKEMVLILLSKGANVNTVSEANQETALTLACGYHCAEIADILCKSGADLELGGKTPLMKAAEVGNFRMVRWLILEGADVNAATKTGDTAFSFASNNGYRDVVELLTIHQRLQNNCNCEEVSEVLELAQLIKEEKFNKSIIKGEMESDDDLGSYIIGGKLLASCDDFFELVKEKKTNSASDGKTESDELKDFFKLVMEEKPNSASDGETECDELDDLFKLVKEEKLNSASDGETESDELNDLFKLVKEEKLNSASDRETKSDELNDLFKLIKEVKPNSASDGETESDELDDEDEYTTISTSSDDYDDDPYEIATFLLY